MNTEQHWAAVEPFRGSILKGQAGLIKSFRDYKDAIETKRLIVSPAFKNKTKSDPKHLHKHNL